MRVKRIIYFLLIGIIGLNGISSFTSGNIEQEIVKSRDRLDEFCMISNQNADFQIPIDSSDESTEIYGFELLFPNDNQYFQIFPSITLNITNFTVVNTNEYESKISSKEPSISIENSFDPENPDDWETLLNDLEFVWNQIEESIQISIDFSIINGESGIPLYHSAIFKDLTAPLFSFGFEFNDTGALIPYDGSIDYFNSNPFIYFNITDNLENVVDICLTVNTHLHQISNLVSESSPNNQQEMLNITLPEWDEINEGLNYIPIFLVDSAGNPTSVEWLEIIKDTSPPEFRSNRPNRSWLRIGGADISEYENPIYDQYEIVENPIFNCQFADIDIESVKLIVELPDMDWDLDDVRYSKYFNDYSETNQTQNYKISIYSVQINFTNWVIEFPDIIWDQLQNQDMEMDIILNDFAGNTASYDFTVKHVSTLSNFLSITESSTTFIALGVILYCIALISFLTFSIRSVKEKYSPLEEDLKKIDPEILEVVIHPLDQENLINVVKYCKDLKNPDEYEKILPPQIHDFLKVPLQILNIKEIHLLLTRYRMDSLHLEEFVREMIALGPKDRHQFLIDYMENFDNDIDDLEDMEID
jgi:hypothetical protein